MTKAQLIKSLAMENDSIKQENKINRMSCVTLHHQLGLPDGTVLEDTFDEEPMIIQLGEGEIAEGLELSLLELVEGDEQVIDIKPDLAFGYVDETLFVEMPRSDFDPEIELQAGLIIEFSTPSEESIPGTVLEFNEEVVKVDLNHPLAGQIVRYKVKIVKVENQPVILN